MNNFIAYSVPETVNHFSSQLKSVASARFEMLARSPPASPPRASDWRTESKLHDRHHIFLLKPSCMHRAISMAGYYPSSRYGHALELLVEQLNHLREMAGRERICIAGAGPLGQHQA